MCMFNPITQQVVVVTIIKKKEIRRRKIEFPYRVVKTFSHSFHLCDQSMFYFLLVVCERKHFDKRASYRQILIGFIFFISLRKLLGFVCDLSHKFLLSKNDTWNVSMPSYLIWALFISSFWFDFTDDLWHYIL